MAGMTAKNLSDEALGVASGRGRLAGRRVAIIGAGQVPCPVAGEVPIGNGRAISLLCAREGAALALCDIDESAVQETAHLAQAEGARVSVSVGDATDPGDVSRFVSDAVTSLGALDGLALVVGGGRAGDLATTSMQDWDWTFALNTRSQFLALQAALPVLSPGSSVVLISSIAGYAPVHEMVAYHAAKAALEGLKQVVARLAAERGIRVNIVAPGSIDTPTARRATSPTYRAAAEAGHPEIPLRRTGTGWEVAYPTVFLLSGEASFITGHTLVVDGGFLALRR